MRILAIDDEAFILELLPKFTARLGFSDVDTAPSGNRALQMLSDVRPAYECFLIDISMPEMDGVELCTRIRALPGYRRTPIIMLTAMVERSFVDRAFTAGATDYATKPFDLIELGARLNAARDLNDVRREAMATELKVLPDWTGSDRDDHAEAFDLRGAANYLDVPAARNYLNQLSRAGLAGSQIFAASLDRSEVIHARATRAEFLYVLAEVGTAIDTVLRPSGYLMTYIGNGCFVIVSNRANLDPSDQLESEVQALLDDLNCEYDDGTPLDIEVSFGNPLRPSSGELSIVDQVFERAVSRAKLRQMAKEKQPRPPGFVFRKF